MGDELKALLAREHAGENRRERLIGRNETIAGAMYSSRLVNEALSALGKQFVDDGRLDSVSLYSIGPTADFHELDTREWQDTINKEICSIQLKSRKEKREEIEWVLKQKLRLRSQIECCGTTGQTLLIEMGPAKQGRKGQSSIGRESKKDKSKCETVEPTDVFSAMPPVESLKALVSHVMTERVDKLSCLQFLTCRERTFIFERDVCVEPSCRNTSS